MPIEVADYDPAWPAKAAAAIAELTATLPGLFTAIEHIGSTSVPGLAAKPVIDLMAAVAELDPVLAREQPLIRLRYRRHDGAMAGRLFYLREENGLRAYHLHVVPDAGWITRNERLLRDHLRAHPADAARYAKLKRCLAGRGITPAEYTRAKTGLIQELTDRARAARGLPRVPVWEE